MQFCRLVLIVGMMGFLYSLCISCADSEIQANNGNFVFAEGYLLETDENYFFVGDGDTPMFADNEVHRDFPSRLIHYIRWTNYGDKIGINIDTVGDLYPRVMNIHQIELIETGDISNIDEAVISQIIGLGFHVRELKSVET